MRGTERSQDDPTYRPQHPQDATCCVPKLSAVSAVDTIIQQDTHSLCEATGAIGRGSFLAFPPYQVRSRFRPFVPFCGSPARVWVSYSFPARLQNLETREAPPTDRCVRGRGVPGRPGPRALEDPPHVWLREAVTSSRCCSAERLRSLRLTVPASFRSP